MGVYRTAEVCVNGHHTTDSLETSPERRSNYCPTCGAETISRCPECSATIRGDYDVPGVVIFAPYEPPSFCYNCGSAMPWTEAKVRAAQDLIDEVDSLSSEEREILKDSILELTRESPRLELASVRYKRLVRKSGKVVGNALNSIVISIATEAAKGHLGME